MTKRASDHTHKYEKIKWGRKGTVIWKCAVSGCPHYLHVELVLGRLSCCWKCGSEFEMTGPKLLRRKPKCDKCQHTSGQGVKAERPSTPDLTNINIDDLLENL